MSNPGLRAGAGSDTGRQRDINEDAFLCQPDEGIFVVIDGVGGYAGGEVAAAEAREVIHRRLQHRTGSPEVRLREAVTNANNKIYTRSQVEPQLFGMACVLTAALVEGPRLYAAHVGDTRLYKIRGHRIEKLTRDHSFVGLREDSQELSEYEAMHHPRRNEILRDVGSALHEPDDANFIDIVEASFEPDCALVLCSDGLTDLVPSRDVLRLVHEHAGHPAAAVEALIEAANDAGGKDNITVVVVEGVRFGDDHWAEPELPSEIDLPASADPTLPDAAPSDAPSAEARVTFQSDDDTPSPWRYYFMGVATTLVLLAAIFTIWALWPSGSVPGSSPASRPPDPPSGLAGIINNLLDEARPGATVTVPAGLYRETVRLRNGVTVRSVSPGSVRLVPPVDSTTGERVAVWAEGITDAALIGFVIGPDTAEGVPADSFAVGILARHASVRIDSVTITGTTRAALDFTLNPDTLGEVTLQHSVVSNNAGIGLIVRGDIRRLRLLDNEIQSNGSAGVVIVQETMLALRGNTISGNGTTGIAIRLDTTLARLRRLNTVDEGDVQVVMQEENFP